MTPAQLDPILAASDQGLTVAEIAAQSGLSCSYVYKLLQEHRPNRPRKPKGRTSDLPRQINALLAQGIKPARVAFLLGITRAYVYAQRTADFR